MRRWTVVRRPPWPSGSRTAVPRRSLLAVTGVVRRTAVRVVREVMLVVVMLVIMRVVDVVVGVVVVLRVTLRRAVVSGRTRRGVRLFVLDVVLVLGGLAGVAESRRVARWVRRPGLAMALWTLGTQVRSGWTGFVRGGIGAWFGIGARARVGMGYGVRFGVRVADRARFRVLAWTVVQSGPLVEDGVEVRLVLGRGRAVRRPRLFSVTMVTVVRTLFSVTLVIRLRRRRVKLVMIVVGVMMKLLVQSMVWKFIVLSVEVWGFTVFSVVVRFSVFHVIMLRFSEFSKVVQRFTIFSVAVLWLAVFSVVQ